MGTTEVVLDFRLHVALGAAKIAAKPRFIAPRCPGMDVQVATGYSEVFGDLRLLFDGCLHYRIELPSPIGQSRVVTERILSLVPAGSGFFASGARHLVVDGSPPYLDGA
jgi:hypothetical protein